MSRYSGFIETPVQGCWDEERDVILRVANAMLEPHARRKTLAELERSRNFEVIDMATKALLKCPAEWTSEKAVHTEYTHNITGGFVAEHDTFYFDDYEVEPSLWEVLSRSYFGWQFWLRNRSTWSRYKREVHFPSQLTRPL